MRLVNATTARQIRFLIAGGSAALILMTLSWTFGAAGMSPFTGTLIAYLIAFAVGYSAQRFWTFAENRPDWTSFPRYLVLQLGCGVFSGLLSHTTVSLLDFRPFLMSLTTTIVASAVSYVVSARWVFAAPASRTR